MHINVNAGCEFRLWIWAVDVECGQEMRTQCEFGVWTWDVDLRSGPGMWRRGAKSGSSFCFPLQPVVPGGCGLRELTACAAVQRLASAIFICCGHSYHEAT